MRNSRTLLSGIGETHLEVVAERFKNKFGVDVVLKPALIPYRETIKKKVEVQGKHKKQSGGAGQYGDVWLRIEPYATKTFCLQKKSSAVLYQKTISQLLKKGYGKL